MLFALNRLDTPHRTSIFWSDSAAFGGAAVRSTAAQAGRTIANEAAPQTDEM